MLVPMNETIRHHIPQNITLNLHSCKKIKLSRKEAVEAHRTVETSMIPSFLDNRRTDDGKFVSLTRRSPSTPQEDTAVRTLNKPAEVE
jgi:hypothetical protein